MKQWVRLASRFYPAAWRRRYATEFDAMLDEMDARWKDVFDTLKGAVTMQFTFWNLKGITLTCAAIGAVIAAAISFGNRGPYQSMSIMHISVGDADAQIDSAQYLSQLEREALNRTSLELLITGFDLYKKQRMKTPMEDTVKDMRDHDISIRTIRSPGSNASPTAFSIAFSYPDPKLAEAVNWALVSKFMEQNETYNHGVLQRRHGGDFAEIRAQFRSLGVLDLPTSPAPPILPRKTQLVLIGLFAGLLAGLSVSYALRWRIMMVRRPA